MTKNSFLSIHKINGENFLISHDGYYDGVFNYYKTMYGTCCTWCAIVPGTGLAIISGVKTRKECAKLAHEVKKNTVSFEEKTKNYKQLYDELIREWRIYKGALY